MAAVVEAAGGEAEKVAAIVVRGREAGRALEAAGQDVADKAVLAAGWALLRPEANFALAEMAVRETGMGNVADKFVKNRRKTLGLLRDMQGVRTLGVVREAAAAGLVEILRPMGVVAAITPSTNPVATPANNILNALKTGNAIVLAPSPKGLAVAGELVRVMLAELRRARLPLGEEVLRGLVQVLPAARREMTQALMRAADVVVVTGSQNNVRAGYASGTPCLGVGAGNVTTIVDESADVTAAAGKIAASKTFDNATSCSSENSVILVEAVADASLAALRAMGGVMLEGESKGRLREVLWPGGGVSRDCVGRDAGVLLEAVGMGGAAAGGRFLMVAESGVGADFPFSGEKMSPVLTVYRVGDFDEAVALAEQILTHQGRGHSVGLHSAVSGRGEALGLRLPACRVIVNQAHCFAAGGAFNNGLPFSLSMGCGTWGGNSFSGNFNFRHLSQSVLVSREIAGREPALAEIFGDYWREVGEGEAIPASYRVRELLISEGFFDLETTIDDLVDDLVDIDEGEALAAEEFAEFLTEEALTEIAEELAADGFLNRTEEEGDVLYQKTNKEYNARDLWRIDAEKQRQVGEGRAA